MLSTLLRRSAALALAAIGFASTAHAGYVVINADPLFTSSPLEGYGWSATGALYLPEGCIGSYGDWGAGSTVTLPASSFGPCGAEAGLILSDVSVRFYKASDLSTASIVTLGTYLPLLEGAGGSQLLTSVTFSTDLETGALSRVVGLTTTSSNTYSTTLPNLTSSAPATLAVDFVLDFNMYVPTVSEPGFAAGAAAPSTSLAIEGNGSSLTYTVTNIDNMFTGTSYSDKVTASDITVDNPLSVPTPGTMTLALLAGVAAWSERRRLPRRA